MMKKTLLFLALIFLILAFCTGGFADIQMTSSGNNYASFTAKVFPIDKDRLVITVEQLGIRIEDSGKGPFNNMATHLVLVQYVDKGVPRFHGYITNMDKDGDKIVWEIWDAGENKGKGKIIGATGKFEGMEGTVDFMTIQIKGFPEDTGRLICHDIWKVTLKNPLP
jgi:hypothetical protein